MGVFSAFRKSRKGFSSHWMGVSRETPPVPSSFLGMQLLKGESLKRVPGKGGLHVFQTAVVISYRTLTCYMGSAFLDVSCLLLKDQI